MKITRNIFIDEYELTVTYDYQPEEKPERGPEAQYSGCNEEIEIQEIKYKRKSVFKKYESRLEEIEHEIYKIIKKEKETFKGMKYGS